MQGEEYRRITLAIRIATWCPNFQQRRVHGSSSAYPVIHPEQYVCMAMQLYTWMHHAAARHVFLHLQGSSFFFVSLYVDVSFWAKMI